MRRECVPLRKRLAATIEERLVLMAPARRLRLALAEEVVQRNAGDAPIRVLDAGCGDGALSLSLAKRHRRWTLVGVDRREDLLETARARARARGLGNASFVQADLTTPLSDAGFGVVLAIECLSEIPDDRAALRTLADALLPGGLFVGHVPDSSWRAILPGSPSTWREQVRQGYTAREIADAVREAGLDDVEVMPTYRTTAAVAQEVRDRIKHRRLSIRVAAFPAFVAAARLERWGVTGGRPNALLVVARRPRAPTHAVGA